MKRVIKDQCVFRRDFRVRQEVSEEIQTSIYFIKDELQISIENHISCKTIMGESSWLHGDGLKILSL